MSYRYIYLKGPECVFGLSEVPATYTSSIVNEMNETVHGERDHSA